MTWKEININYEKKGGVTSLKREEKPQLGKNWKKLMDSADRLLWLFMISQELHKRMPYTEKEN